MLITTVGFSSCDDNFEQPPLSSYTATATIEANTTLQELKEAFHQDVNFYATEVGTKANGDHYIVQGRIVSSDAAGNIYKKIAIEDETGGAIFSINATKLYETYKYGQMVVIDVTGMYYGNYGAGVQIGGKPESGSDAPSRMQSDLWTSAAQVFGLVNTDKIDIYDLTVAEALDIRNDATELLRWQGRLVRINDVHFVTPGKELGTSGTTNNTSYIADADGKQLALNTSGYSTLWSIKAPKGTGSVVAVLSNYTSGWQLLLNDAAGLVGFTEWSDEPADPSTAVGELSADFETGALPTDWTDVNVSGNKSWYVTSYNNNSYAAMTGYKGTAPFDEWLITAPLSADKMTNKVLTFDTQVNGYSSTTSALEVYILDGPNPSTANKTQLNPTLAVAVASGYSDWANSGEVSLAQASGVFYIGWRYVAATDPGNNYATWCIDNISVK